MRISIVTLFLITSLCAWGDKSFMLDGLMVERLEPSGRDSAPPPRGPLEFLGSAPVQPRGMLPPEDTVQRHRRAAERFASEGRWDDTLREYQEVIRLQAEQPGDLERAALAATLAGQFGVADGYFQRALTDQLDAINYWAAWGGVLIRLERWADAHHALTHVLARNPDHLIARYYRLVLSIRQDKADRDEAWWMYRTVAEWSQIAEWLAADDQGWQSFLGDAGYRALITHTLGDVDPGMIPTLRFSLQDSARLLRQKRWDLADQTLAEVQSLGITRPFIQMERIRALFEMGQHEDAYFMADTLLQQHPDAPALAYARAYLQIKGGRYEQAAQALSTVRADWPDQPQVDFAYVCARAGMGELDTVWPLLEQLAIEQPDRFPGWMEGDAEYLQLIRADARYPLLTINSKR